jgi:hypothetical protein
MWDLQHLTTIKAFTACYGDSFIFLLFTHWIQGCGFPLDNIWMPEPFFMKLGTHSMANDSISEAYFESPYHQSVCLCIYSFYWCKATAPLFQILDCNRRPRLMKTWAFDSDEADELSWWELNGDYTEASVLVCVGEWIPVWVDRNVQCHRRIYLLHSDFDGAVRRHFILLYLNELRTVIEKAAYVLFLSTVTFSWKVKE